MKERQRRNIIVGIFVIAGIFLFIFAIYLIGQKEYVFGRPYNMYAVFNDVKGLKEGDKVRMSGIDIGTVSKLEFVDHNKVLVQFNIDNEQFSHIRLGSKVLIGSQGLMGAKVVRIIPAEIMGDPIAENDTLGTLEQIEIDDVVRQISGASTNITHISEELLEISKKINDGEGVFGQLLSDNSMNTNLEQAIANLEDITSDFSRISTKLSNGDVAENINDAASDLKELTDKLVNGEGSLGHLLTDTSLIHSFYLSSLNLQQTTANLGELTAALNNDSSALNLLIEDPSFADSLEVTIERLNEGIVEVTEAAEAVQRSGIIRLGSKRKK